MKNAITIITLFLVFLAFGCQSDSNYTNNLAKHGNDKIFGNLYVRYIQPDNQMKAEANFSKGSSKSSSQPIELVGGVSFQGSGLSARKILDKIIKYSTERVSNYKKDYRFGFNIDGEKINIPMEMASVDSLFPLSEASITNGMKMKIFGDNFSKNERLVALISDKTNYTTSFVVSKITKNNTFVLPGTAFEKLKKGKGNIYVVRKRTNQYNEKKYELNTTTEYYSKLYPIKISE